MSFAVIPSGSEEKVTLSFAVLPSFSALKVPSIGSEILDVRFITVEPGLESLKFMVSFRVSVEFVVLMTSTFPF